MGNRVAAVQMVSTSDIHANVEAAGKLIRQAAAEGANLVLLPEKFAVLDGGPLRQYGEVQGDPKALLQSFLSTEAAAAGITLVAGTIPLLSRPQQDAADAPDLLEDSRVRPACLVFDPQGKIISRYDKIHLFDVIVADKQAEYSESRSFEPGQELVTLDTSAGCLGLSICYDLRFPELYRKLFDAGAELVTVPSAFTKITGAAHWETLLRARAIENQFYVVAANQGGVHNEKRETYGHTMIVDPWGTVLDCVEQGEGLAIADVDLERLAQIRRNMPIRSHRRL